MRESSSNFLQIDPGKRMSVPSTKRIKSEAVSSRLLLHQVRNLLQPLQTHVDLLGMGKTHDPVLRKAFERVATDLSNLECALGRIAFLVRDLEFSASEVTLKELANSIWQTHLSQWSSSVPAFSCELGPERVWVDERHFAIAFGALFENALEAAAKDKKGTVRVTAQRRRAYQITIRSTGGCDRGVPKFNFKPFYSTKGSSGSGLGLCTAERIIRAHGGKLTLECSQGATSAKIVLPLKLIRV
jgi:signal transduction histidine kinase